MNHLPHELRDLKFSDQIRPFVDYQQQQGAALVLMHEALSRLPQTWMQSPHWDHEPTQEELDHERKIESQAQTTADEVEALARNIYLALTGNTILSIQNAPSGEVIQLEQRK